MNTELLLKVKAAILAEPEGFDMCAYFRREEDESECGTTACIAGHALIIGGKVKDANDGWIETADRGIGWEHDTACKVLKITPAQATHLFYDQEWPSEFANRYRRAKTARGRAKVAAGRIDYFIATEGK